MLHAQREEDCMGVAELSGALQGLQLVGWARKHKVMSMGIRKGLLWELAVDVRTSQYRVVPWAMENDAWLQILHRRLTFS
jgi:hypothetical protein